MAEPDIMVAMATIPMKRRMDVMGDGMDFKVWLMEVIVR